VLAVGNTPASVIPETDWEWRPVMMSIRLNLIYEFVKIKKVLSTVVPVPGLRPNSARNADT